MTDAGWPLVCTGGGVAAKGISGGRSSCVSRYAGRPPPGNASPCDNAAMAPDEPTDEEIVADMAAELHAMIANSAAACYVLDRADIARLAAALDAALGRVHHEAQWRAFAEGGPLPTSRPPEP